MVQQRQNRECLIEILKQCCKLGERRENHSEQVANKLNRSVYWKLNLKFAFSGESN